MGHGSEGQNVTERSCGAGTKQRVNVISIDCTFSSKHSQIDTLTGMCLLQNSTAQSTCEGNIRAVEGWQKK